MFYSWHAKSEGATLVCVLEAVTGGILRLPALANCTYSCSSEYFNFCQSFKIIKKLSFLVCLCVWCIFAIVCMWRSKNNFRELVLFLNQMGPRNQTQAVSHVSGLGFALLHKYSSVSYSSPKITTQKPLPWWFLNADATEEAQARSGLGSFPAVSLRA